MRANPTVEGAPLGIQQQLAHTELSYSGSVLLGPGGSLAHRGGCWHLLPICKAQRSRLDPIRVRELLLIRCRRPTYRTLNPGVSRRHTFVDRIT